MQLVGRLVVLLVRLIVLLGARQLVQRLEEFLILVEAAPTLINFWSESALLLFGLVEVYAGDLNPILLRLGVAQALQGFLLHLDALILAGEELPAPERGLCSVL